MFIHLFLSILTLENESVGLFKMLTSTETCIQEAVNPQKHHCENLKYGKCDTALRKEREQLSARFRNVSKHVLTLIRGKQRGLKWLGVNEVLNFGIESPDSWVCDCS